MKFKVFPFLLLVCLVGLMVLPLVSASLNSGLVGYWKFDEVAGSVAGDSSGYVNNGVVTDGIWNDTGILGGSLFLNNVGYVTIPANNLYDIASGQTLSIWVYVVSYPSPMSLMFYKAGCYGFEIVSDGSFYYFVWAGSENGEDALTASGWHNLAWTFDGSVHNFYLDGNLLKSYSVTETFLVAHNDVVLGSNAVSGARFNGYIDEARIYNRALSGAEVLSLYNLVDEPVSEVDVSGFSVDFLVLCVVLFFIVMSAVLMAINVGWLPRFVFGVLGLSVCAVALGTTLVLQPYIQLSGLLMCVLLMLVAAVKRG